MFSVIIPLYNKEKFITRSIESVLNQTFSDFELIIIDDGSTDKSLSTVESLQSEKIKIFSQKNAGVSAARNKGASLAQHDYLAFLDADDVWNENFLLEMKNLIESFPQAGIYGSNNYFLYPSGKKTKNELDGFFVNHDMGIMEDYFKVFADLQRSPFSNSNVVIPKRIYDEMGGYKTGVRLTEDSDLWCRIALKYDVAYNKKPLSTYFVGLEGSTHTIFENKRFQVSDTLNLALENKEVPNKKITSVQKLIALQNLSLLKRGILTGHHNQVFELLFDKDLFKFYPKEFIKCVIAFTIPTRLFNKIKRT